MAKQKYIELYKTMDKDRWYTAAELGVAPATMTAMVNRNLVERTDTSPRKYRRLFNPQATMLEVSEMGTLDAFILKLKERKCTFLNRKGI